MLALAFWPILAILDWWQFSGQSAFWADNWSKTWKGWTQTPFPRIWAFLTKERRNFMTPIGWLKLVGASIWRWWDFRFDGTSHAWKAWIGWGRIPFPRFWSWIWAPVRNFRMWRKRRKHVLWYDKNVLGKPGFWARDWQRTKDLTKITFGQLWFGTKWPFRMTWSGLRAIGRGICTTGSWAFSPMRKLWKRPRRSKLPKLVIPKALRSKGGLGWTLGEKVWRIVVAVGAYWFIFRPLVSMNAVGGPILPYVVGFALLVAIVWLVVSLILRAKRPGAPGTGATPTHLRRLGWIAPTTAAALLAGLLIWQPWARKPKMEKAPALTSGLGVLVRPAVPDTIYDTILVHRSDSLVVDVPIEGTVRIGPARTAEYGILPDGSSNIIIRPIRSGRQRLPDMERYRLVLTEDDTLTFIKKTF